MTDDKRKKRSDSDLTGKTFEVKLHYQASRDKKSKKTEEND